MSEERLELEKISPPEATAIAKPGYARVAAYPDAAAYGSGYAYPENDERLYLRRMWRAIKKRKLVMLVIAVIVTAVVTVEVFRTKSVYQASTTIEIGKENRTLVQSGDLIVQADESDDTYLVAMGMKTKIRLVQSRPLMEDVVVNLKLDQNPRFIDIVTQKSYLEAFKTIASKFRGNQETPTTGVVEETPVARPVGDVVRSRQESARLAPYVDVLASNLSAEPLPDTRMLVISFTHTDPTVAATVVDNVAQVFMQRSFVNKTEKYSNTSEWLDKSTREFKARVEEAEQNLVNYSKVHNIYSIEGKENLATDKLTRLHDQATRSQTDRMLKESLYQEVKAGRVAQLPEAFSDPKTNDLEKKLGELTTEAAQLDVTYGPKNSRVIEKREQIAAIQRQITESRASLEEKLKADYERSVRDEASLQAALNLAKTEAAQQNQDAIQFNILKQEVETTKALYKDFLQKTNQAKIQEHEQHGNMKMIDPPQVPVAPIGPNRLRTIFIGFLVSLMAGVGLVFVLEYLDNTVKTVEDVNRYTQLPALSVIPSISGRRKAALLGSSNGKKSTAQIGLGDDSQFADDKLKMFDTRSSVAEAYRVLRTSVMLSSVDRPPKTILITSGQPGEGKTTTVVNTAISLAQLGGNVLIIDCDLRKPAVHKVLGIGNQRGLTTLLSSGTPIARVIQKLSIENLSVLPSGPIPPNPAEIISSARMKSTLRALMEIYDHIIIDSPPLLRVTDPVILSTMVDGVILVVHGGKSTRDVVRRTRQELSLAGARIYGVVLNNVDLDHGGYEDYYYESYSDYDQQSARASGA